jgi:hypothetical protein
MIKDPFRGDIKFNVIFPVALSCAIVPLNCNYYYYYYYKDYPKVY